ncbi:CD1375 family protein [Paenibacillus sp. 2TAB23]
MATVYANLIRKGLKTINDVPANIKIDVIALLTKDGKD